MATYTGSDKRLGYLFTNGGGGGGSSTLAGLSDVDLTSPSDGQILKYDATAQEWINANASGGASGHTYSTTEQVVGTWIDGKPLYEKTISFTNQTATFSDFVTVEYIADVGKVVSMDWTAYRSSNDAYYTGNGGSVTESASYNTYRIIFRYSKALGALQYFIGGYGTDITDIAVILRYTKSTD